MAKMTLAGGDKRATQMVANPEKYFQEARARARREAEAAIRRERELKRRNKN